MGDNKLMAVEWKKRRGELVATAYGREIAVRKAGKRRYSAHYGPDRWAIGSLRSRYKTEWAAKTAAIRYAQQASENPNQGEHHNG